MADDVCGERRVLVVATPESAPQDPAPTKKRKKKKRKGPLKIHRYGGWLLYFWHGMRPGVWLELMWRNRFKVTLNCLPNILIVTLFSPINTLLYGLSELIYRRRAAAIRFEQPPIFVLGHWRSGTTLLHDLLACDPEFGFPTTYACFFPSHFVLTERTARAWFNLFLPKKRPMDNMQVGFDRPQEEEFALCNLGLGSIYRTMAFPRAGPVDRRYIDLGDLSDAERRSWVDGFLWFIRRVALRQRKRLVLKSPTHTARVATMLELFPEARFVFIARDPFAVFPSTMRLWKSLNSVQGLQNPAREDPWLEGFVLSNFEQMDACYARDRELVPEGQLVEIKYEELVADPKAVLRRIYDDLGLGPLARAEAAVDDYLARMRDYQTNIYELPGEQRALIQERWGAYIERYGYGAAKSRAGATPS
ncbi:MAG: sulfotransferase family protein [Methyloligellaceae bacterium]